MKIKLSAAQVAEMYRFVMGSSLDPSEMEPVKDRDGNPKLVDDVPVYRVSVTTIDAVTERNVNSVSLKIKHKPSKKVSPSLDLKLVGDVVITPYPVLSYSGDKPHASIGISITADAIAE